MNVQGDPSGAWLVEQWAGRLADVLQSMTEVRPHTATAPGSVEPDEAGSPLFWQELPLSLASDASIVIAAPEESWLKLGEAALRAIGLEEVAPADARSTYLEIITQTTSSVAQAIGKRLGVDVTLLASRERTSQSEGIRFSRVLVSMGELENLPVLLAANPALEAALTRSSSEDNGDRRENGQQKALTAPGAPSSPVAPPAVNAKTLDLLMEVELPLSVSFGRARLPLREVLKLTSGCIVELNRAVSEPVELIINGAVIARGEVVVVEGNYGIKIEQIISRQERLRTLK